MRNETYRRLVEPAKEQFGINDTQAALLLGYAFAHELVKRDGRRAPLAVYDAQGLTPALIMLAIVLVYQQFENYVLQPTILGKAADVSGFFVIVSVMIFGALEESPIWKELDRTQKSSRAPLATT